MWPHWDKKVRGVELVLAASRPLLRETARAKVRLETFTVEK
jgi:hypothetical protein